MSEEESYDKRTEWSYRNGVVQWNPGGQRHHTGACDSRAPDSADERLLDPDPELTLYREVTGRTAWRSTTYAGWRAEFLATGLDLPMERMLALVTEQQHDYLLDGPATGITTFTEDTRAYRRQQRRTGARQQQLRQNALSRLDRIARHPTPLTGWIAMFALLITALVLLTVL